MIDGKQREIVNIRSGGQCEAMLMNPSTQIWTRCWKTPVEVHHMLTRARGGDALDKAGETYHLIALCPECHRSADGELAYSGQVLIEGYAIWSPTLRRPVYIGPDDFLTEKYGDVNASAN